jgi:hypothetical protein
MFFNYAVFQGKQKFEGMEITAGENKKDQREGT